MPMVRSVALCLVILISAVLMPLDASAQQATPSSVTPQLLFDLNRSFEASGIRFFGTASYASAAYVFASDDDAERGLPLLATWLRDNIIAGSTLRPASVGALGDEAIGFAGETPIGDADGIMGLVVWRDGNVVYVMTAAALSGDPLSDILPIARSTTSRGYDATEAVTIDPITGMHEGGAWNLLPGLEDMPEGFVFDEETLNARDSATPVP